MESPELDRQPSDQILMARTLLKPRRARDAAWPALAAAALFAFSAMTFAVTAVMTPAHDQAPGPAKVLR